MAGEEDIKFMQRCLDLARKAEGYTFPNPLVGSVVVHSGKVIGEGYHLKAGEPHAEVNAIASVADKNLLAGSTIYVNLEPCSHFGKTPPCADLIISSSIPRVIIGTMDSNELVSGRGVNKLLSEGRIVITGILEDECRRINRRFFTFHEKKRPYITLKWAESADGFIDKARNVNDKPEINWISGNSERVLVHKWRSEEQAILVGGNTVRNDAPKLDVRHWGGHSPIRLIVSSSGNINGNALMHGTNASLFVFTHNPGLVIVGATVYQLNKDEPTAFQIVKYLYEAGVQSLLIEGGAEILNHFIENELWDEARIFKSKNVFGNGLNAPQITGRWVSEMDFSGGSLHSVLRD